MRKKLGSFLLGLFVFTASIGLATKSLLMNLASDSEAGSAPSPRRAFASSDDKKTTPRYKNKI